VRSGRETLKHYLSGPVVNSTKCASGDVTSNLCFYIWWDLPVTLCVLVRPGRENMTCYFSCSCGPRVDPTKSDRTRYAEHVFLHPVGSVCHVARSGSAGV
jgi:hypothetical protein